MKLKIILLINFIASVTSVWAKAETKLPDTYAFTRGVEAYQGGKNQDALDWFNKEISEHPDNGYAYVYTSILRYGNQEYGKSIVLNRQCTKKLPKKEKEWRSLTFVSCAEVYTAMGDTIKALNDMSQAIQTNPTNARFYN